jgi:hypothetical protein
VKYSDGDLNRLVKDGDRPAVRNLAAATLEARRERDKALAERSYYKEMLFASQYFASPGKIRDLIVDHPQVGQFIEVDYTEMEKRAAAQLVGSSSLMGRSDYVFRVFALSPHDVTTHKWIVHVEKSRTSATSRHAFLNIDDAVAFMKGFKR